MEHAFTSAELKTRKWWLWIFLFSILLEIISCIDALELGRIPKNTMSFYGLGMGFSYKLMFYYFGYLKRGTKFLTCTLCIGAVGIGIQALSFYFEEILVFKIFNSQIRKMHPLFLFIMYLNSFAFLYATVKLRRMNKIRKLAIHKS